MSQSSQRNPHVKRLMLCILIMFPLLILASTRLGPVEPALASTFQGTVVPSTAPFPDFGYLPAPSSYTGPVFKLSQGYPKVMPKGALPAFFKKLPAKPFSNDFEKGGWRQYMMAVRDYCFEGNTGVDFRVENNQLRKWYHMPWQHYGPSGREGVHGLTKEAQVLVGQLGTTQNTSGQTYAVGFFNDRAGYAIGRVWANHSDPNPGYTSLPGPGFPNGTVIFKLLFVDNDPTTVPGLQNPMQWEAYITTTYDGQTRAFKDVSVIQMDIAIKDDRALTGWLFGTFQYNGQLGAADWKNLIPVGIMWGNDPEVTSDSDTQFRPNGLNASTPPANPLTQTKINLALKETTINPNTKELPPTHLGWNGRLNGPVDNYQSSCMSCHMTAEVPSLSPANPTFQAPSAQPPVGSPVNQPPPAGFTGTWYGGWMRWFQNLKCGEPFDKAGNPWTIIGAKSTDFGLQLSMVLTNFGEWQALDGLYAKSYKESPQAATQKKEAVPNATPAAARSKIPSAKGRAVHPVTRDEKPPKQ